MTSHHINNLILMLMSVRYMYFGKCWIPNPIIRASLVVCCVYMVFVIDC